jgi:hypothetical protein
MRFAVRVIKAAIVLHNISLSYDPIGQDDIEAMLNDLDVNANGQGDANGQDDANGNDNIVDEEYANGGNNARRNQLIGTFPMI